MSNVYFNQTDLRWKNTMYSSVGNKSQTIGNSGCGPTSGAMVVSNLSGKTIYPNEMAKYYVDDGYRTASNGTSWSAFSGTAKKYNLEFKQTTNVTEVQKCVEKGGMAIMSAKGSSTALFSTNGHIIVISDIKGNDFVILDPYLYDGKYEINGRNKKATVKGNEVYVSKKIQIKKQINIFVFIQTKRK